MDLERKPVITYAGDQQVFQHLQNGLVHGIPQERVQWRRSHGRLPCLVSLEATFQPLSDNCLQDDLSSLARRPCLHTYWLDSSDVETYKSSGREPMLRWLNQLRQNNVVDWLIVAVESSDTRSKANKLLPRSSVMDRIKQDILSKHGDRCVALVDPSRSDARSAGSLHALLAKMRQLLLVGLNRVLVRFEAAMRSQRDKRTGSSWNFGSYFLLQEELSLALQQLSLLEEALLQYDELEALLNQLIASWQQTGVPLAPFTGRLTDWVGLTVPGSCSEKVRNQISQASVSFLDFRNYLFARQCVLLQRLGRHGEIAQRSLTLLFSATLELRHLQIEAHPGSVSCWAFSTCMHVIDICQQFDSEPTVHLAGLYDQARLKLHELGALCGLLPLIDTDTSDDGDAERRPSSDQLHLSVTLSAGAGDSHRRLSEALSGADQLRRLYLELAEVATGTYKHVGRLRTARTVGCQLAEFQLGLGRTAHAASLLADAAAGYRREHWQSLAARTHVRLAHCYRLMADNARYIQTCSALAGCLDLDEVTHDQFVQDLAEAIVKPASSGCSEQSSGSESRCVISSAGLLSVESARSAESVQASDAGVHVSVIVQVINKSRVTVPVELGYVDVRRFAVDRSRQTSPGGVLKSMSDEDPLIDINMEYKQDKSLNAASLVCRNASTLLRRLDSIAGLSPVPGSSSLSAVKASKLDGGQGAIRMSLLGVLLKPGLNELIFQHMVEMEGDYSVNEMLLKTDSVDIVVSFPTVDFSVKFTPLQLSLVYGQTALLSGVAQEMSLQVSCGSKPLAEGGEVVLNCSEGLQLCAIDVDTDQVWSSRLCLSLPALSPLQRVSLPLLALSELTQNKQTVEHTVNMTGAASVQSYISFHMPFSASFKLHTAGARKYVQVQMCGNQWRAFELQSPELAIEDDSPVHVKSVNDSSTESLIVSGDGDASYLWELLLDDPAVCANSTSLQFRIQYRDIESESRHGFKMDFTLSDYMTLFSVVCAVEPGRGSELCRAGCLCQLHVTLRHLAPCPHLPAVMYEVLADQHAWAVCGTSSGVLTVDSELQEHHVQLEIMPLTAGSLPLPSVRLSKYIPAQRETIPLVSGGAAGQLPSLLPAAPAVVGAAVGGAAMPRLEPFRSGQVYNASRGRQVQILAANVAAAALTAPLGTSGGHYTPQHSPRPPSDPATV